MNGNHYSKFKEGLEKLIDKDARIEIRDGYLSQDETRGLIRSSDCYISLHRSEGLGLGLAEAMYLGKPVIATRYSGNMEFMNDSNSLLVPCKLIDIPEGAYPNWLHQHWADPDIAVATKYMRSLVLSRETAILLGAQSSLDMRQNHSYALVGGEIRRALKGINNL